MFVLIFIYWFYLVFEVYLTFTFCSLHQRICVFLSFAKFVLFPSSMYKKRGSSSKSCFVSVTPILLAKTMCQSEGFDQQRGTDKQSVVNLRKAFSHPFPQMRIQGGRLCWAPATHLKIVFMPKGRLDQFIAWPKCLGLNTFNNV